MKIKKLKGDWRNDAMVMCQMIVALKEARAVSSACMGCEEFQSRSADAILALANRLMEEHVEKFYEPDMKRFKVTFDVKRSGVHTMEVDAETEDDAKNLVRNKLEQMEASEFDDMKTDFIAAEVFESEEMGE